MSTVRYRKLAVYRLTTRPLHYPFSPDEIPKCTESQLPDGGAKLTCKRTFLQRINQIQLVVLEASDSSRRSAENNHCFMFFRLSCLTNDFSTDIFFHSRPHHSETSWALEPGDSEKMSLTPAHMESDRLLIAQGRSPNNIRGMASENIETGEETRVLRTKAQWCRDSHL